MELRKVVSGLEFYNKRHLFQLKSGRTYILPSAFGWAFTATIVVLSIMAIGFANNLVYLITFFLISVALISMVIANSNLVPLLLNGIYLGESFAHTPSQIQVEVGSKKKGAAVLGFRLSAGRKARQSDAVHLEEEFAELKVHWIPKQRGWQPLPALYCRSEYPFGLFRVWKRFDTQKKVLVFPKLEGTRSLPWGKGLNESQADAGVFREHRVFQNSDSPKRIDWRASARRQELLIKSFEEDEEKFLQLDWASTVSAGEVEKRISQLALWVDEAENHGFTYSLSLGTVFIPEGHGEEHRKKCLESLALIDEKDLL